MSQNPFVADAAVPERLNRFDNAARMALKDDAVAVLEQARASPATAGIITAADAQALQDRHGIGTVRDLMLLLLDTAERFAHPPISGFHVGAVGLAAESGDLVLGGNVEFPGAPIGFTMHGEGTVFTRAMHRGADIAAIAIGEAHPCAHCRQCLAEYARSDRLDLIDPLGHTLTMDELYPWPFDPAYLGERGAVPGSTPWPTLRLDRPADHSLTEALLQAGRRSHSPYSKAPAAIALRLRNGQVSTGFAVESVAFNPTIAPVQMALVELVAQGLPFDAIDEALIGTVQSGAVDYVDSTVALLRRVAPAATVQVLGWQA